jgi:hypothetical protein
VSVHPARYDDELQRRAVYDMDLQFEDDEGNPINLTGWTVASQLWNVDRTVKYLDFTVTYVDRLNGQVKLSLTDVQTASLTVDKCYYDVLLTSPGGIKDYYIQGTFYVSEGYTA